MKIAISLWPLRNENLDGIGYFTIQTTVIMIRDHPEHDYILLCEKNGERIFRKAGFNSVSNVKFVKIFPSLRHPVLYLFWMELVMPFFFLFNKVDVFLAPDGFLSLLSFVKQVPVIHDLNFKAEPGNMKGWNKLYYNVMFPLFIKKAKRIATVSHSSLVAISALRYKYNRAWGSDIDIDVVYSAPNNVPHWDWSKSQLQEVRNTYSDGCEYLIFIGTMYERKNIKRLVTAFQVYRAENPSSKVKLLLVGHIPDPSIKNWVLGKDGDQVIFVGRTESNVTDALLQAANAMVFVPTYEGFGVPIIEAMQHKIPVICSDTTSMPEISGRHAILVDPHNVGKIKHAIKTVIDNPPGPEELEKAREHAAKFTWKRTTELLLETINKATCQKD